jgi:hypothetical protein
LSSEALTDRDDDARELVPPSAATLALAAVAGIVVGAVAQLLRQASGDLSELGGSTAPWITIGFVLALPAARRRPLADGAVGAGLVMATYLFAWLLSYHALFAIRESVGLAAGWSEARPWVVAVAPVSVVVGLAAAFAAREGLLADVALAVPIAWSVPEVVRALDAGARAALLVALPIAVLAVVPLWVARTRRVNLLTVACASVALGAVAYVAADTLSLGF